MALQVTTQCVAAKDFEFQCDLRGTRGKKLLQ